MEEVPESLKKNTKQLKEEELLLEKLKSLQPDYNYVVQLREKDIPNEEKTVLHLEEQLRVLQDSTAKVREPCTAELNL